MHKGRFGFIFVDNSNRVKCKQTSDGCVQLGDQFNDISITQCCTTEFVCVITIKSVVLLSEFLLFKCENVKVEQVINN